MMSVLLKPKCRLFKCHEPLVSSKWHFPYPKLDKTQISVGFESVGSEAIFRQCDKCNFGSFSAVWHYFHKKKCIFKTTSSLEESTFNRTQIYNPENWLHCDQCEFKTSHKTRLKVHVAVKHISSELQKLSQGDQRTDKTKLSQTKYNCGHPYCKYTANNQHNLRLHKMLKHPSRVAQQKRPFVFKEKQTHTSGELQIWLYCAECPFKTMHSSHLRSHVRTKHVESMHSKQSFKCGQCNYTTSKKPTLYNHITIEHSSVEGPRFFQCDHCNYKTVFEHFFKSHMSTAHNNKQLKSFKCSSCAFTTVNVETLRSHIQEVHAEGSFFCTKCDYKTFNRRQLIAHQKIHSYFDKKKHDLSDQYEF